MPDVQIIPYPWHLDAWQQCIGTLDEGRLAHALLLTGAEGTGKGKFARALVQRLMCSNLPAGRDLACGKCKSCQMLHSSEEGQTAHPDVSWIFPEKEGGLLKVDQVRELVTFFSKQPQFGGRRVALIEPAENMNVNAANALLKTLEEPGHDTFIILVCRRASGLLPTIRSRCQERALSAPSRDQSVTWLSSLAGGQQQAELLLNACQNRPLAALALSGSEWIEKYPVIAKQFAEVRIGRMDPVLCAAQWQSVPSDLLMPWLFSWYNSILECSLELDSSQEISRLWKTVVDSTDRNSLSSFGEQLVSTQVLLRANNNINPQLLLEQLLIDWRSLPSRKV